MKAELVYRDKWTKNDNIVEIKIWAVPITKDKPHGYKYSMVYIHGGVRVVGYDNAEGRSDHRHHGEKDEPYEFEDLDKLFEDFYGEVRRYWR